MKIQIWKKISQQLKNRRITAGVLIGALVLAFLSLTLVWRVKVYSDPNESPASDSSLEAEPEESLARHPLTGFSVSQEQAAPPQVYAVVIDHSSSAWPLSGLDRAFLVIEAPVEAGIPRLLAFFYQGQEIDKIGPVRSARPYFVDWANELDAMLVHVGGSNQALEMIANNGTFDLNQFWNGQFFWRDNALRSAPHNVYTSTKLLASALVSAQEKSQNPSLIYGFWKFEPEATIAEAERADPVISFGSGQTYAAAWEFDQERQQYRRRQGGAIFKMQDGAEIWADNVAVVITDIKVVDGVGRKEIQTQGRGDAYVFQNGQAIEAKWIKPSINQRMRFTTLNGLEISMNPGITWIEVIDGHDKLKFNR